MTAGPARTAGTSVRGPLNYELMPRISGSKITGWTIGCLHCREVGEVATAEFAGRWAAAHDMTCTERAR